MTSQKTNKILICRWIPSCNTLYFFKVVCFRCSFSKVKREKNPKEVWVDPRDSTQHLLPFFHSSVTTAPLAHFAPLK